MKWTLLVFLGIFAVSNTQAQNVSKGYRIDSPVNIASENVNQTYIAPPEKAEFLKSASPAETQIHISYVNFPAEAQKAFEYAVSIWKNFIQSDVPINIHAEWKPINSAVLALSRPAAFYLNFDGAPLQNTYYPVALAEKLGSKEINPGEPGIYCTFNSNYAWYFGLDGNTPVTKYDFVSSVLHEVTHGLGFSGFLKNRNGSGLFDNDQDAPSVYDYYLFNQRNQQISDKSIFTSPSAELLRQLTSDKLKLITPENCQDHPDDPLGLVYAPVVWQEGSSIYHLKKSSTSANHLMTPSLCKGAAYHHPGEATLQIISEIGWGKPSFRFDALKDLEEACETIPVSIGINSTGNSQSFRVKVIFSTDYFMSADSASLSWNESLGKYSGEMAVNFHTGRMQYYFKAQDKNGKIHTLPASAPQKKFALRIGPDYFAPEMKHNPLKIVQGNTTEARIKTWAEDNLGVKSVKVEYLINGIVQEPMALNPQGANQYEASLHFPEGQPVSSLEYRIIAEDLSSRQNKKTIPATGFFNVGVVQPAETVRGYYNDFESQTEDFVLAGFSISESSGFSGKILHTEHPYTVSALEDEKNNLIAQLKHPVVLQAGGSMSFDEIVLVEPGEEGCHYQDQLFWDYVVVEGSKDGGITWQPFTEGYDSGKNENWFAAFNNHLKSSSSDAMAQENMFDNRTIQLTQNNGFDAGDTVLFRFRLASDYSVNGWGWAIDNLQIQELHTATNHFQDEENVKVYPNPFSHHFVVDCSGETENLTMEIVVTDLNGKSVHRETGISALFSPKTTIDLTDKSPGIYLVHLFDDQGNRTTKKMVKK